MYIMAVSDHYREHKQMTTLEDEKYEKLLEIIGIARRIVSLNHRWNVPNLPKRYKNIMCELEDKVSNLNQLDSSW